MLPVQKQLVWGSGNGREGDVYTLFKLEIYLPHPALAQKLHQVPKLLGRVSQTFQVTVLKGFLYFDLSIL